MTFSNTLLSRKKIAFEILFVIQVQTKEGVS